MFQLPGPETVKVGAKIPRASVVVTFRVPETPVIVKVCCPGVEELLTVSVSTLEPVDVGLGAKEAVTPAGKPVTASCTLPVKPYSDNT